MHHYTNHLIHETSPYLLQHAHNPVDWYAWGDEAFQKAKQEDKPVLVSIGYSACHWCHVMEKESFEDVSTAEIMNQHFVNIKVDREERPDIDHIYMDAVQAIVGNGGWPLNVFLTPEAKPFYGGTYFPPIKAFNRSSWKDVLIAINQMFQERRNEVETQANNLQQHLITANSFGNTILNINIDIYTKENINLITNNLLSQADRQWGGFGKAPKFPQAFSIQYLLRQYYFNRDENALQQALLSLDKMIYGGIYDQLGGGFARYSTDEKWFVPHFEKMLYDNALLISVLSEAYQLTKKEIYATTINDTIKFIERDMKCKEGGFYSALDADSEGVEGKFYTWNKAEIENILKKDAHIFCDFYNITEKGNWEHTNILWITTPLEKFAIEKNLNKEELKIVLEKNKQQLLEHRTQRICPGLDDKILLGWNALINIAYSKAFTAISKESYREKAIQHIQFIENKFFIDNEWHHTYKNGITKIPAFLDDLAYLIQAYILLQQITSNEQYLQKAKALTEYVIQYFSEEITGYFYYTSLQQKDIIIRKKEIYDGATPSANAIMMHNLYYLGIIFNIASWQQRVDKVIQHLSSAIIKHPTSFAVWASFMQQIAYGTKEVVIIGEEVDSKRDKLLQYYLPNIILQTHKKTLFNYPLLKNKDVNDKTMFFICQNYACLQPVENIEEAIKQIRNHTF